MAIQVTRCPHCQTSFRIRDEQLAAAKGKVRCGSCLQVFKGSDYLQTVQPKELIHDDMDNPDAPKFVAKSALEIDSSVFSVPEESNFLDQPSAADQQPALDESWVDELLTDPNPAPQNESEQPLEQPNAQPEADHYDAFADTDDEDLAALNKLDTLELDLGTATDSLKKQSHPLDSIAHLAQVPLNLSQPQPAKLAWGWLLGCLVLFITISLQIGYFNFDNWARTPQWRGAYQQFCHVFGCELPKIQNIKRMQSQHFMVKTHPQVKDALMVDLLLYNQADYAQPYPDLLLVFKDINERTLASRLFAPKQYLQGELSGQTDMLASSHTHIALEILDPGPEAVSYHIELVANQ